MLADWRCPFETLPVGKGRKIHEGTDVAVLSIGHIGNNVTRAIEAVGEVSVAHYDMRFLKPIDTEILDYVGKNYRHVITVEDGVRNGGLGSAVVEYFADKGYEARVTRLGMPTDSFVEHGTVAELQHIVGIDAEGIAESIRQCTAHDA